MIRFRDVTPSIENASGFFNFRQIEKAIKNDQWPSLQVFVSITGSPSATPLSVENFLASTYDITIKNAYFSVSLTRVQYTSSTSTYPVMIGSTTSSFGFGQNSIVKLIVNSDIIGAGGTAGAAGTTNAASGSNGGNGGPALYANYTLNANQTIIVENNANILGGGGGGGGGGAGENSTFTYLVQSATQYAIPNSSDLSTAGTYTFWNHSRSLSEPWQNSTAVWNGSTVANNPNASTTTYFYVTDRFYMRGSLESESGRNDYHSIYTRQYLTGSGTFGRGGTGGAGGGWNSSGNNGGAGVNGLIAAPDSVSSALNKGGNGGAGGAPGEDGGDGGYGLKATTTAGNIPFSVPAITSFPAVSLQGNGSTGGTAGVAITGIDKITLINNGTVGTTI